MSVKRVFLNGRMPFLTPRNFLSETEHRVRVVVQGSISSLPTVTSSLVSERLEHSATGHAPPYNKRKREIF